MDLTVFSCYLWLMDNFDLKLLRFVGFVSTPSLISGASLVEYNTHTLELWKFTTGVFM